MLLFHETGLLRIVEARYEAGLRLGVHTHALQSMSIVLAGRLQERRGRIVESARPLSLSFMAADLAHDDEFGPGGGVLFQVHFESRNEAIDDYGSSLFDGWHWFRGGPAVRPFLRLVDAARARSGEDIQQIVLDVVTAAEHPPTARGTPPLWLERVREAIDDSREWPRVGELASVAGVHRVRLARQFRRYFGCSVSAYVRRSRVQLAAERIVAGGTIAAASHDAGFHDHAHLVTRSKRRRRGRRRVGATSAMVPSTANGRRSFRRLLAHSNRDSVPNVALEADVATRRKHDRSGANANGSEAVGLDRTACLGSKPAGIVPAQRNSSCHWESERLGRP